MSNSDSHSRTVDDSPTIDAPTSSFEANSALPELHSSLPEADRHSSSAPEESSPAEEDSAYPHWRRNIALYLLGESLSIFGSSLVQFAILWHLTLTTQSASIVTTYAIFAFLPQAVITLFGGALADRVNRKLLIIVPDLVIALATLGLAILMATGHTELWMIYLIVFIRSVGAGFQQPAVNALIPSIVPDSQLMRFNGINGTLQSLIGIASPAASGVLYGLGGVVPTLWVDILTALLAAGILLVLPVKSMPAAREKDSIIAELFDGIRFTWRSPFLRWMMLLHTVIVLFIVGPNFLLPLLVTQKFGPQVWQLSAVEMSLQIGMIVGGILVSTILASKASMRMLAASAISVGFFAVGVTFAFNVWLVLLMNFFIGFTVPLFSSPALTEIQRRVDEAYLGRLMSQFSLTFAVGVPAGIAVFGALSAHIGVAEVIGVTGAVTIVYTLWTFFGSATGRKEISS